MAYRDSSDPSQNIGNANSPQILQIDGQVLDIPDASYLQDADMVREGADLILEGPNGTIVIEGYFNADPTPNLTAPDGITLTPQLVESFAQSNSQYAELNSMSDVSPVGEVQEVSGQATVTRLDGSIETITNGVPIFQGDIIETSGDGAVNIAFLDETSFAVSEGARLAIDEYVYDPASQSGESSFSVLKGVFVFTSGLIGREDPDDVIIETPIGSIGIRGTIIMGNINTGEITVAEGAIVLRDFSGHEMTLAGTFETGRFDLAGGEMRNMGEINAAEVSARFASVSGVSPTLFSSINDIAAEQANKNTQDRSNDAQDQSDNAPDNAPNNAQEPNGNSPRGHAPGDDIMGGAENFSRSSDFETNQPTFEAEPPPNGNLPPPPPPNGNLPPPPPPPNDELTPPDVLMPPLEININTVTFNENDAIAANTIIATVTGRNGASLTNLELLGPNASEVFVTDNAGVYEIRLVNSDNFDFESVSNFGIQDRLTIRATDTNGQTVLANMVPSVNDINETAIFLNNQPQDFFAASGGTRFEHNFDQQFFDEDSGINGQLTYSINNIDFDAGGVLVGGLDNIALDAFLDRGQGTNGWNFNAATGRLEIFFQNAFAGDHNITFDIDVIDGGGMAPATQNFTLDMFTQAGAGFGTLSSSGNVISGTASGESISLNGTASNNRVFTNDGNDTVNITSTGMNNYINTGSGADTINIGISINSNTIIAGNQSDDINIDNVNNFIYGNEGTDTFTLNLNTTPSLATLESAAANTLVIDGGFGNGDVLRFTANSTPGTPNTIDFRLIDNTFIINMEILDFTGNGQDNNVTLDFQDIFTMTDDRNTLEINLDSNDTLDIDLTSENVTQSVDATTGNDLYYINDGVNEVTLIVDNNGSGAVNII